MLENPEIQQKMGAAARQRVAESYTWDSTAEQYLEIMKIMEKS
jgi:glycosyltransferase involved in cell wall biosynthesis